MQFHPNSGRDESGPARIRALHLSLNSPVVALDDFPVGPARAGVALCEGAGGEFRLEIAVRSVRTGQQRFYSAVGEVAAEATTVEAALAFAEGMGFLFDDDEVATRGAEGEREAAALWRDLAGDFAEAVAAPAVPTLREVPVGQGPERNERIPVERPPVRASAAPRLALSKFRLVLAAVEADPASDDADGTIRRTPQRVAAQNDRIRLVSRF